MKPPSPCFASAAPLVKVVAEEFCRFSGAARVSGCGGNCHPGCLQQSLKVVEGAALGLERPQRRQSRRAWSAWLPPLPSPQHSAIPCLVCWNDGASHVSGCAVTARAYGFLPSFLCKIARPPRTPTPPPRNFLQSPGMRAWRP